MAQACIKSICLVGIFTEGAAPMASQGITHMASGWEVKLGGSWKPMSDEESAFLDNLAEEGKESGEMEARSATYKFDTKAMTQTNVGSEKSRRIRRKRSSPAPEPLIANSKVGLSSG